MILEVGAGGVIEIPRRTHEYHTRDLWGPHGVKIGDAVIDTDLKPVPWCSTKHERYTEDVYKTRFGFKCGIRHRQGDLKLNYANRAIPIRESEVKDKMFVDGGAAGVEYSPNPRTEKDMVQVIDGGPEGTVYIGDSKAQPEVNYARYYRDIPKRDSSGRIVLVEIDGVKQVIYEHRKGDIILDSKGNPRIIPPGTIPCPQWFTRADRARPTLRYDTRDLYYRSLEGITAVLSGLSNEDLVQLDSVLDPLIHARLNGEATQVIKSKYLPKCTIYANDELQYELFDDTGNLVEVLSAAEVEAKYGEAGIE